MDLALAWLEEREGEEVLRLGPPLRPPHALRAPRAVPLALPGPEVRRRGGLHRPRRGPARRVAEGRRRLGPHAPRPPRRPRREPGRARRERPHLLRLRRDAARAADRPHALGRPGPQPGPGLDGGRDADGARPRRAAAAAGDRRTVARAARPPPGRRLAGGRLRRDLLPPLPLRLAAPAVAARREVEVHRGAHPRALRRAAGPGGAEERLRGLLAPQRRTCACGSRRWRAAASRPRPTRPRSTPRPCRGSPRSATWARAQGGPGSGAPRPEGQDRPLREDRRRARPRQEGEARGGGRRHARGDCRGPRHHRRPHGPRGLAPRAEASRRGDRRLPPRPRDRSRERGRPLPRSPRCTAPRGSPTPRSRATARC